MQRFQARAQALALLEKLWLLKRSALSGRVIYYHSVHPTTFHSQKPNEFRRQMAWLRERGYRSVRASQIPELAAGAETDRWVAITFDDGYRDNIECALPVLDDYGFTATFFVVGALVGTSPLSSSLGCNLYPDREMMTKQDLSHLANRGFEIGCHGLTHQLAAELATRSASSAAELFEYEVVEGRRLIEEAAGVPVTSFAYPNGQRGSFSTATRRVLARQGFRAGFTTIWGAKSHMKDALALPRCEISIHDSLEGFANKMLGRQDFRRPVHLLSKGAKRWGART